MVHNQVTIQENTPEKLPEFGCTLQMGITRKVILILVFLFIKDRYKFFTKDDGSIPINNLLLIEFLTKKIYH